MHREEAGTVSFSRVQVGAHEILFDYRPAPLCEPATGSVEVLSRFAESSSRSRHRPGG
jgi:hypothetical protein